MMIFMRLFASWLFVLRQQYFSSSVERKESRYQLLLILFDFCCWSLLILLHSFFFLIYNERSQFEPSLLESQQDHRRTWVLHYEWMDICQQESVIFMWLPSRRCWQVLLWCPKDSLAVLHGNLHLRSQKVPLERRSTHHSGSTTKVAEVRIAPNVTINLGTFLGKKTLLAWNLGLGFVINMRFFVPFRNISFTSLPFSCRFFFMWKIDRSSFIWVSSTDSH